MNIAKHMEVVFVAALVALGSASYFADAGSEAPSRPVIQDSSIATGTKMATVVVKGKRPAGPVALPPTLLAARADGSRM